MSYQQAFSSLAGTPLAAAAKIANPISASEKLDQAMAELIQADTSLSQTVLSGDKRTKEYKADLALQQFNKQADKLRLQDATFEDIANIYSQAASSLGSERVKRGLQRELLQRRIESLKSKKGGI